MNTNRETRGAGINQAKLVSTLSVLTLYICGLFPVFAWYGFTRHGRFGIITATIAAMSCWLGAFVALFIIGLARDSSHMTHAILGGMLFRLGIPFGVGFLLMQQAGPLADVGVFGTILVFYLATLPVETVLSLRFVSPAAKASKTT